MKAAVAALSLIPALACAAISITGPSPSAYWVQNTSNTIDWSFSAGDPNPVTVIVTNAENATLNGDFFIAQFVNVSQQSFTVTNVTLRPGSDYQVVFVNPANESQVYANSSNFDVKPPGTALAPSSNSSGTSSSSSSPTSTSNISNPSSTAPSSSQSAHSGSIRTVADMTGTLYAIGACGLASLGALLV
ncbi:hypothetical protein BV25DRAFT_1819860 [Artomyces pyxidatus]|uniref:Uncharacterized protein n=1 Tax=Artomyces pyxidatus TaxID=48021 RepID=A0ACB8TGL4_9AGAM|nr:hypothetical protein BV25DRAFT_1819860 [Artomyces pyxidatus]